MGIITQKHRVIEGQRLASDFGPIGALQAPIRMNAERSPDCAEGALGTYAKSSSPLPPYADLKTAKNHALRDQRYTLQNSIRKLVMRDAGFTGTDVPDMAEYNKLPRVVKCLRGRVALTVDIKKSVDHGKAFYCGLFTCGSVWACPLCAAKIQERRREEIASAVDWSKTQGLVAVMVTFTFPHYDFQTVADLLKRQAASLKYLRSGKSFQNFKSHIGMNGFIRSLEVTFGSNGWHPHTHELWFIDPETDPAYFSDYVTKRWEKACDKQGLIPKGKLKAFRKNAVNVRWNANCSDYLAKQDDGKNVWGVDREMSLSTYKRSVKTMHPFELVQLSSNGDRHAGEKFIEYIQALKGKAQIYWSQGLKKKVSIDDKTDSEIASELVDDAYGIAELEFWAWKKVLDLKARSHLLLLAEVGGSESIHEWLKEHGLHEAPKIWTEKIL